MQRLIAFLRGINVGGNRIIKMDTLRAHFESFGFTQVETFIASGNVSFETNQTDTSLLEEQIEEQIQGALGYVVITFIRSIPEVVEIAGYDPFPARVAGDKAPTLYVCFLKQPLSNAAQDGLRALRTETDDFHAHGRELYWTPFPRLSESPVSGAMLAKTIGVPTTMRNITTVRKLAAKYGDSA